jgi:histidinol dehydrogenase
MIIKIYTLEEAKNSILKLRPLHKISYAAQTLEGTEELFGKGVTPPMAVSLILDDIEQNGDVALKKWSQKLDKFEGSSLVIGAEAIRQAYEDQQESLQATMKASAIRIRDFYERQPVTSWLTDEMGGKLGQRFTPIEHVGVYVPGGTAPLPSSLLMSVIPAQVAGVKQIVVCTPPNPRPSILAAAHICGIEQVYQAGGAQAIAAMAFGTESIPKVEKIVGAGNLFVTLAKQQLYGTVGLDGLAGPTETMVIADSTATPSWVAADLLAQAEHDWQASAILLTPDRELAGKVQAEVEVQTAQLSRKDIISVAMKERGGIVITESIDQAASMANEYAAEHLCLSVAEPQALMEKINNAGGFFLGEHSFEVLGDYVAGPSHVMPTGGTARFAAPLNVLDFVKLSSVIALDKQTAQELSGIAAEFAETEQLTAHAAAARKRLEAKP